jgi:hypothetical protein
MQTGIDSAWRSRVSSFYSGAKAAAIIASASNEAPKISKASEIEAEYVARPFRFEDLNGKPEPEKWGPKYSKPVKRARFNDETNIPTNCASGQKRCFDAAKHRAKLGAEFAALANADQREWALGKLKSNSVGTLGLTIGEAYARAMTDKAARLAGEPVAPVKRLNEQCPIKPAVKAARRPRKAAKQREAA